MLSHEFRERPRRPWKPESLGIGHSLLQLVDDDFAQVNDPNATCGSNGQQQKYENAS
jgi:hypothetical protein